MSTSSAGGASSTLNTDRRLIRVRDEHLAMVVGGNGPPLLYLHDASGGAWLTVHELLAEQFTVYVPDHPGFGGSSDYAALRDVEGIASLYAEMIHLLDLGQPLAVVGASFGGWIAAELAAHHPQLVSELVLINAIGLPVDGHPVDYEFDAGIEWAAATLFHDPSTLFALLPPEPDEEFLAMVQRSAVSFARFARDARCQDPRLPDVLAYVTASTLVVTGAEDRLVPQEHGQAYTDLIPNARRVEIQGAGHASTIEKPTEIAQEICRFITSRRSSSD